MYLFSIAKETGLSLLLSSSFRFIVVVPGSTTSTKASSELIVIVNWLSGSAVVSSSILMKTQALSCMSEIDTRHVVLSSQIIGFSQQQSTGEENDVQTKKNKKVNQFLFQLKFLHLLYLVH